MSDVIVDVLERLYNEEKVTKTKTLSQLIDEKIEEQYNHPIQTRPKSKPGVTGEEPKDIKARDFGDEGGNTSFSSKRVNKSSNREFEDEEDDDKEGDN